MQKRSSRIACVKTQRFFWLWLIMNTIEQFDPQKLYVLSEKTQFRPASGKIIVESFVTGDKIELPNAASLRLLLPFLQPISVNKYLTGLNKTTHEPILKFLTRCLHSKIIVENQRRAEGPAKAPTSSEHLEFHDLAFHTRSRRGRTDAPSGATGVNVDKFPEVSEQHEKKSRTLNRIALEEPRSQKDAQIKLREALEKRRTRYSSRPVALDKLSAILYRSFRVTEVSQTSGDKLVRKVYPSGGSRHSLELYVISNRCVGLPFGGYHYNSFSHCLDLISVDRTKLGLLLAEAQAGTGTLKELPSVLLVLSSRFARVSRKYQSIAYHLILQEVGALYQTLYLNSHAEDVAACAIGAGDADLFAKIFKTNYFQESSVGEFILGG